MKKCEENLLVAAAGKKTRLTMTENTNIKQLRIISMPPFTKPFLLHLPKYTEFALNYFLKLSRYVLYLQHPFPPPHPSSFFSETHTLLPNSWPLFKIICYTNTCIYIQTNI